MQTAALTIPPTLDDLVADPALEEVWVNGPDQVFVAEGGISRAVPMPLTAMDIRGFDAGSHGVADSPYHRDFCGVSRATSPGIWAVMPPCGEKLMSALGNG